MKKSDCILWTGSLNLCGYGRIGKQLAHRRLWERERGKIPPGKVLMHTCDVRNCVNLDHLRIGTQQENIADMLAKGRGGIWRDKRGSNNPAAKLSSDDVWAIRHTMLPGKIYSRREIAKSFGVETCTIDHIASGTHWKHITPNWPFDTVRS